MLNLLTKITVRNGPANYSRLSQITRRVITMLSFKPGDFQQRQRRD
jgi:hypothetical protein